MANMNIPNLGPAGSQGTQNNQTSSTSTPNTPTPNPMGKVAEKIKNGSFHLLIAGLLVFISYVAAGLVIDKTELGWFWGSLVVFIITALIIWAIDGATGSEKTPARTPVKAFFIIGLLSSMINGCNENRVLVKEKEVDPVTNTELPKTIYSDTLDLSVATLAVTDKIFVPGDNQKIVVVGNPVRLNQDILAPGEWIIPVTGSGPLVFSKIEGRPTMVYLY